MRVATLAQTFAVGGKASPHGLVSWDGIPQLLQDAFVISVRGAAGVWQRPRRISMLNLAIPPCQPLLDHVINCILDARECVKVSEWPNEASWRNATPGRLRSLMAWKVRS